MWRALWWRMPPSRHLDCLPRPHRTAIGPRPGPPCPPLTHVVTHFFAQSSISRPLGPEMSALSFGRLFSSDFTGRQAGKLVDTWPNMAKGHQGPFHIPWGRAVGPSPTISQPVTNLPRQGFWVQSRSSHRVSALQRKIPWLPLLGGGGSLLPGCAGRRAARPVGATAGGLLVHHGELQLAPRRLAAIFGCASGAFSAGWGRLNRE